MSWRTNPNPTIKPPFGSYIDWNNPLTSGLRLCCISNEAEGVTLNDLVENRTSKLFGTIDGWVTNGFSITRNGFFSFGNILNISFTPMILIWKGVVRNDGLTSRLICKWDDDVKLYEYLFSINATANILFATHSFAAIHIYTSTFTVPLNEPILVAVEWKDGNVTTYLNGELKETAALAGADANNPLLTICGGSGGTQTGNFNGICEFAYIYYNSNTNTKELIQQLYHEPYCFINWPTRKSIFDFGTPVITGKLSRYHTLNGLGGQGQQTWNPLA